jgi:ATP-dependent helicase/nuclease subunit A
LTDLKTLRENCIKSASMQQFEASSPANSIWVEASAGTGKTKVLSDRVLRLLLSGVNPSRILCLTYTKAAASEMNNRILERLSKWATIDDETLNNNTVTIRHRDTMEQITLPIDEVIDYINKNIEF